MITMEQLLTKLKTIQPDTKFSERSKALILSTPQTTPRFRLTGYFLNAINFSAAVSLAIIFILFAVSGISFLGKKVLSPSLLPSLSQENLKEEIETINIQLSQIQYYQDSVKKTEVALKETSTDNPNEAAN